jgi:hypothetical protein
MVIFNVSSDEGDDDGCMGCALATTFLIRAKNTPIPAP